MEGQYVIRTNSKERSSTFLIKSRLSSEGYYYTAVAHVFVGAKAKDKALAWARKDLAKNKREWKKENARLEREVKKGNISVNKVLLVKGRERLKDLNRWKLKAIKL